MKISLAIVQSALCFSKRRNIRSEFSDYWDPWDISTNELKQRLEEFFPSLDLDSNGLVSHKEFLLLTFRGLNAFDEEDAAYAFSLIDHDRDNKISWDEFLTENYGDSPKEWEKTGFAEMKDLEKIRFQTADQDRDGLVELAEYCLFRNPSKSQDFLQKVLRNAMLAEDTDMDGKISRKEFKGSNFDLLDCNHNGYISGSNELEFWISPQNLEDAIKEANEIFDDCDSNSDRNFSLDEVLEHWDEFVDSAATQYGQLLKF